MIWLKSLMKSFIFCAVWNFDAFESQKRIFAYQILKISTNDLWIKVKLHCHCRIFRPRNKQKKFFKSYLETLRQQFTIGTKNNLSWKFLLLAMVRIHLGKPKINLFPFSQYLKWKFIRKRTAFSQLNLPERFNT